jgi:hypothetical protein|tara:strand:- start:712 stop:1164 length:453 start_codon:yes stop_codon:yes gene_type:complete
MGKHRAPLANNDVIHLVERRKQPEQKLWTAVLAKAFDDAFYCSDERAALSALGWIKGGSDFGSVCRLAGRDPSYVKERMLNKVIVREAAILGKRALIKKQIDNVIKLKPKLIPSKPIKIKGKKKYEWKPIKDYSFLPKYDHGYIDRKKDL